ncbi:CUB and sushi domain-containing protein 3-like isoform X2 [Mya arenaria]|uniref:CUB and sushi domain-containing protein 3-like isoform X2 n=1 Tax=Mya arenaria TaxID=6604 RepID=UPI0022E01E29|nr:CUB and sushi domain-containing protein 3-like isoform X2 [Mya arenaria]
MEHQSEKYVSLRQHLSSTCLEFDLSRHASSDVNYTYNTVSTVDESACFLECFDTSYCRTFRYSSGTCYIYTCGSDCVTSYLIPGSFDIYHRTCYECPTIANTAEYTVTLTGLYLGDTLTTTCNFGYEHSSGDLIRTCQGGYAWGGDTASCSPVDCDIPSTIAHASFTLTSGTTTYGSFVTYSCESGYIPTGENRFACADTGQWTGLGFSCEGCGFPPNVSSATYTLTSGTNYDSVANYVCVTGYVFSATSQLFCDLNTQAWSGTLSSCVLVDCLLPPTEPHATYTLTSESTTWQSTVEYACENGYNLNGDPIMECSAGGVWVGSGFSCEGCGNPPIISYSTYSLTFGTGVGSIAQYTCSPGYTLESSSELICISNGTWGGILPVCSFIDCGSPPNVTNASYISSPDTTLNSSTVYSCNTGFQMTVTGTLLCESDGQWIGILPVCIEVYCTELNNPPNGFVNYGSNVYNSTASFNCSDGYNLVGSPYIICSADGSWNATQPICSPADCLPLYDPLNGYVSHTSGTTYIHVANYTCEIGYYIDGDSLRICQANASWSGSEPSCIIVDCNQPPILLNGIYQLLNNGTKYSDHATYSCNLGYTISGALLVTCLANGNWNLPPPACTILDCGSIAHPVNGLALTPDGGVITTPKPIKPLYIMPCICYPNKTFVGMTQEEIIQQLIKDTRIERNSTTASINKLKCREDNRPFSRMTGYISIAVISVLLFAVVASDMRMLVMHVRRYHTIYN